MTKLILIISALFLCVSCAPQKEPKLYNIGDICEIAGQKVVIRFVYGWADDDYDVLYPTGLIVPIKESMLKNCER